jgi:LmbE family N-acetylglucosaminyl deacetylase
MNRPAVILSPHLDDAAYACFSLLRGAVVLNVFDGVPEPGRLSWWDERCGATDSAEWAQRRIDEDRAALRPYAREIRSAGVLEAAYRPRGGDDDAETLPVVEAALRKHSELLGESVVYAPLAGGARRHPDHLVLREAARSLRREFGFPLTLYADDGYCLTDGRWPGFLVPGGPVAPEWWDRLRDELPELVPLESAGRVSLASDEAAAKRRLMESYETQWEPLNEVSEPPDAPRDPAAYSWEFFWPLAR